MPRTVYVIHRNEAIEDHYAAACEVALTPEGAQRWIRERVARSKLLTAAKEAGNAAVAAWSAKNPNPFTEPAPPQPKRWPGGIGKKDPRYPAFRAQRDAEKALFNAWCARKSAADAAYLERTDAVFAEAVAPFNLSEEDAGVVRGWLAGLPVSESDYFVEQWTTVDDG
jgi:hypothetical protein